VKPRISRPPPAAVLLRPLKELTRRRVEGHFGISLRTAKRELGELVEAGNVEFDDTRSPGHYRPLKRHTLSGMIDDAPVEGNSGFPLHRGLDLESHLNREP